MFERLVERMFEKVWEKRSYYTYNLSPLGKILHAALRVAKLDTLI